MDSHVLGPVHVHLPDVGQVGQRRIAAGGATKSTPGDVVVDQHVADPLEAPVRDDEAEQVQRDDHDDRHEEVVLDRGVI